MKLYFTKHGEICYPKAVHIAEMIQNGETERELFEAKAENSSDYFWCRQYSFAGEKSDKECNSGCPGYYPRNKIKGICKHYGKCYEQTDKKIIIRL